MLRAMNRLLSGALVAALAAAPLGCSKSSTTPPPATPSIPMPSTPASAPMPPADPFASNPFQQPSPLPLHFPQFDKIKDSDYAPAFDRGMAEQKQEIEAIAANTAAPTFDNTIVAMERSGQLLTRATLVFGNLTTSN